MNEAAPAAPRSAKRRKNTGKDQWSKGIVSIREEEKERCLFIRSLAPWAVIISRTPSILSIKVKVKARWPSRRIPPAATTGWTCCF